MRYVNWLAQLDVADRGVAIRERDLAPKLLTALTDAGLVEYAGLDRYSDCCDCALGTGCPVERLGGTDDDPEYVALCPLGEALVYHEQDLRRWRLSMQTVARVLSERLGQHQPTEELVSRRLWEIGRLGPRVRLFLFKGVKQRDAHSVAAILTERVKLMRGLVLVPAIIPDAGILPANTVAVSLSEVLCLREHDVTIDLSLLESLATQLAGEKVQPTILPIPVPAGFTWPQVRLEFISDEDVRIWTVGEPVVKSFQELGLMNTRNGHPTKSWHLLREFAGHEGIYDVTQPSVLYAPEKVTHRGGRPHLTAFSGKLGTALSDLAGHLSKLFPTIPGRPIAEYDAKKHQYRAAITLGWEPGYHHRKASEYGVTV